MSELRAYAPRGIVAIQQQAFGLEYPQAAKAEELCLLSPSVASVEINGPLVHGGEPWFRSYRSIVEEVRAACEAPGITTIVLLAGRQTVGGYVKIATVTGADLDRLGQALPGPASASSRSIRRRRGRRRWPTWRRSARRRSRRRPRPKRKSE